MSPTLPFPQHRLCFGLTASPRAVLTGYLLTVNHQGRAVTYHPSAEGICSCNTGEAPRTAARVARSNAEALRESRNAILAFQGSRAWELKLTSRASRNCSKCNMGWRTSALWGPLRVFLCTPQAHAAAAAQALSGDSPQRECGCRLSRL